MKKPTSKKQKSEPLHEPVMVQEVLKFLQPKPGKIIVDGTLGLGGHSKEIAKKLGQGKLIAIDQDENSLRMAQENFNGTGDKVVFVKENFRNLGKVLRGLEYEKVDGILFDLGISSWQLGHKDRGFSFQQEGPLDMRMNQEEKLTAGEIVNTYPPEEIAKILKEYGEERNAGRIARAIAREREKAPLFSTTQLAGIVDKAVGGRRGSPIHPATRTFQAIRIAVNMELSSLSLALAQAVDHLRPGGRLVVISFHSLEDRIVKETFQRFALKCVCPPDFPKCVCGKQAMLKIITKKPVSPTVREVARNPRARSAKLRVAEKI